MRWKIGLVLLIILNVGLNAGIVFGDTVILESVKSGVMQSVDNSGCTPVSNRLSFTYVAASGGCTMGTTGCYIGGTACNYRHYEQFDLSSIPTGAEINSAILTKYRNPDSIGEMALKIARVTSSWNEDDSYKNRGFNFPSVTEDGKVFVAETTGDYIADVTSIVQAWMSGSINYGFEFAKFNNMYNSAPGGYFKNAEEGYKPKLVIIYNTCIDECSFLGQTRCSADSVQTCGNYDADSCLEWGVGVSCPLDTPYCSSGACVACLTDLHCDDSDSCTIDACNSGTCSNNPAPLDCTGRECGYDNNGCGGNTACGSCTVGTCNFATGTCEGVCTTVCRDVECGNICQGFPGQEADCGSCIDNGFPDRPVCLVNTCVECTQTSDCAGKFEPGISYYCENYQCRADAQCYDSGGKWWDGAESHYTWIRPTSDEYCKDVDGTFELPNCCPSGMWCKADGIDGCADIPWCIENHPNYNPGEPDAINLWYCVDYTPFGEIKCNDDENWCEAYRNEPLPEEGRNPRCVWSESESSCNFAYDVAGFSCIRNTRAGDCDAGLRTISWTVTTEPSGHEGEAGCIADSKVFPCGERELSFFGWLQVLGVLLAVFIFYWFIIRKNIRKKNKKIRKLSRKKVKKKKKVTRKQKRKKR